MKALAAIRVQKIASMSTIQAAEVHGRRHDEPSSKRVNACRSSLNLEDSKKPPSLSRTFLLCGQVSDFRGADILLADFPDETEEVIGDTGYDSNQIRLSLAERNITACIPPKKTGNQSHLTIGICIKSAI